MRPAPSPVYVNGIPLPRPLGCLVLALAFTGMLCMIASPFVLVAALVAFFRLDTALGTDHVAQVGGHHWRRSVVVEQYGGAGPPPIGRLPRHRHTSSHHSSHQSSPWKRVDTLVLEGDDLQPVWPVAPDDQCSTTGCRRPGLKSETYTVVGKRADGAAFACDVPLEAWPLYHSGERVTVAVSGILGWQTCGPPPP